MTYSHEAALVVTAWLAPAKPSDPPPRISTSTWRNMASCNICGQHVIGNGATPEKATTTALERLQTFPCRRVVRTVIHRIEGN